MAKTKAKRASASGGKQSGACKPLSLRERNALNQMMRLVYCWRYVDHARAEAGEPIPDTDHGYNLLTPAKPDKVDEAYCTASHKPMVWQVLVVSYVQSIKGEYRGWAWLKSETSIVAAGDGITPLLARANDIAIADMEDGDHCYARATIMAPWDAQHPIRPDRLAARLQTKLRLTKEDVLALAEWGEPETMSIAAVDLDLQVAKALRNQPEAL